MKYTIFTLLTFIATSSFCQPPTDITYSKQIGRMLKRSDVSTYTTKYFSDLARFAFSQSHTDDKWGSQYQSVVLRANSNAEKFSDDFQRIITRSKEQADKERIVFQTVAYTGRVIISPTESIPIWGPIQKEITNQIFEAAENELTNTYKKKLSYSLKSIREQNQAKYNKIITSGDFGEVKQALDEVNFFANVEFGNLDPEYKDVVLKSQEMFLRESVKTTLIRVVDEVEGQQSTLAEIDKNISSLSKFTFTFAQESNRRFDGLVKSQINLNKKVDAFYDLYKTDKKALDFMQDFLYSKMNTSEKIKALRGGMYANIPDTEKTFLNAQLELQLEKEKVLNSAKSFLNSAEISLKILGDLGLGNSKLVQDISQAVNIGQTAFSAATSFASGDYLGCISSITGLFAKKGDDIAAQRHKQIMKRFDKIDASLSRIEGKIDQLLKGQEQMLKLQVETFDALLKLSDKIDVQHNVVMAKLTSIEEALYKNRQLIVNNWEGKCQACLITIERLKMDVDKGILPDRETLDGEYANLAPGNFRICEEYINTYVFSLDQPRFNPDFNLTSAIDGVDIASSYMKLDSINKLSFNLLFSHNSSLGKIKSHEKLLFSLFFPATSVNELNRKTEAEAIVFKSELYPSNPALFSSIIKPEVSIRHGFVVRNIGVLIGLTDQNRRLISFEQFASLRPPKNRDAKYELLNAIRLNNVAIAQQSILSGEILLPIIDQAIKEYLRDKGDAKRYDACKMLLSKNELIGNNYVKYFVRKHLEESKKSDLQYSYAYSSKDSLAMTQVLESPFPISYIDSSDVRITRSKLNVGWYMSIGNLYYAMPNPSELSELVLDQTQQLHGLLDNRQKLLRHLFSFNSDLLASPDNLNYLIMKD